MFYKYFKSPAIIKSGNGTLPMLDPLLLSAHLSFPTKILITQEKLWRIYGQELGKNNFSERIFVKGGCIEESDALVAQIKEKDVLLVAFGGGSVLDLVKYCASRCDKPYITVPSALSNDAVYSCVSRLSVGGKKKSFGVQPPIGIVVDFDVIRNSPRELLLAGVADIVSNLSALEDWRLSHKIMGEPIDELAYMLSKESVMPLLRYDREKCLESNAFLYDLANAIVTSGLSMIVAGSTRCTSGAEHLISHAIDEYYPERSTIHGLQVGWAHMIIEKHYRGENSIYEKLHDFYRRIGLLGAIEEYVKWDEDEFGTLIAPARTMRDRFTVFNIIDKRNQYSTCQYGDKNA